MLHNITCAMPTVRIWDNIDRRGNGPQKESLNSTRATRRELHTGPRQNYRHPPNIPSPQHPAQQLTYYFLSILIFFFCWPNDPSSAISQQSWGSTAVAREVAGKHCGGNKCVSAGVVLQKLQLAGARWRSAPADRYLKNHC